MKYNNLPKTGNLFRLQQAHPTSSEHDPEGPGGVRAGFHTADQRGESWLENTGNKLAERFAKKVQKSHYFFSDADLFLSGEISRLLISILLKFCCQL